MHTTPQCWKCGYELSGLQVNDMCPECGTPVWSQRPPEQASAEAHQSLVWGLYSLVLFFICLGPLAGLVAIPALVYASKAKREVRAGLLRPSQASEARTGAILGWVTVGLSVALTVVYGLILLAAAL